MTTELTGSATSFAGSITGSAFERVAAKFVTVRMGPYELVVAVAPDGKFLGVSEVRVAADFRDAQQKVATSGYHNVEEFYKE